MSESQPELLIPVMPNTLPENPDVRLLWEILAQRRDWTTRAVIVEQVFREREIRWSERHVRQLAAEAAPEIISGDMGYKIIALATREEVRAFVFWMQGMEQGIHARAEAVKHRRPEAFQ